MDIRAAPVGQAHVWLRGIGAVVNNFGRRAASDGPVHFVLHGLDAFSHVSLGIVDARHAPARGTAGLLEFGAALGEARLGKAEKDEAQDGRRVLPCLQSGICAELIRRRP